MTAETYGLIYNSIADKLEEAGYSVERVGKKLKTSNTPNSRPSGLDWSKSVPTSLFYFPCQAQRFLLKRLKDVIHLTHQPGSKIPQFLFSQHLSHLTHLVTNIGG